MDREDEGSVGLSDAVRIRLHPAEEDTAIGVLWELGTLGTQVESETPDEMTLLAWFDAAPADLGTRLLARVPGAAIEPVVIPDVDWVARFREGFRRFHASGFEIVPAWESCAAADDILRVDPGRAFGTGTHESTRLCLAALRELAAERPLGRVVDVGTGTGILATACRRLGAGFVLATDLDPEALGEAARHRSLNQVWFEMARVDVATGLKAAAFDVVVANMTGPLLREHSDSLMGLLGARGRMVLSGFLSDEVDAMRDRFRGLDIRHDGEWAAGVLR